METLHTPPAQLISALFWSVLLACLLVSLVEAPVLFLLKRLEGKRPLFFVLSAASILLVLQAGFTLIAFLLLVVAGLERMGMGGYSRGNEYVTAAQWIFAGVPVLMFFIRRGLLSLYKFRGNGAAWGYAFISTIVISLALAMSSFLAVRMHTIQ